MELYHGRSLPSPRLTSRLSSLVTLNPVSCTTDSNLLDGRWDRAAWCKRDVDKLLEEGKRDRDDWGREGEDRNKRRRSPVKTAWWYRGGWLQVHLEELSPTEHPYAQSGSRWLGGAFTLMDTMEVKEMTRSSIVFSPTRRSLRILGILPIPLPKSTEPRNLEFLYLDVDLCVFKEGQGMQVLTKNQSWKDRSTPISASSIFGVRRMFGFIKRRFHRRRLRDGDVVDGDAESGVWMSGKGGIKRTVITGSSEIRVMNIGEAGVGSGMGGRMDEEDEFYKGYDLEREILDDPLGHLGQEERQRIMGEMSLKEMRGIESERIRREKIWRDKVEREEKEGRKARWEGVKGGE